MQEAIEQRVSALSLYPINMSSFLALPNCKLDEKGIPYHLSPVGYHPTTIVRYALAQWNQYLSTHEEQHCRVFLAQARWLVQQEVSTGDDASGWPISFPHPDVHGNGPWLSATAQGGAISVLLRAHQLTDEEIFLEIVHRVVRTFERDILDGGVSVPVGEDGVFFEEAAIYPAAHGLSGFIFALIGLYDYKLLADNAQIEKLIDRSIRTLHDLIDAFDVGFWTYTDLLHRRLASDSDLTLQIDLLEALADYCGCDHCSSIAVRWKGYQKRSGSRLHYLITSRCAAARHALWSQVRVALFPARQVSAVTRVCVALTAFPVTGGIRAVLAGVAQATTDVWQIEYLTHFVGANPEKLIVHQF
ncbi:MAG: D-glucuronyl C5-epimerase family protein, partial [Ktedonobacteraceae bacterium]